MHVLLAQQVVDDVNNSLASDVTQCASPARSYLIAGLIQNNLAVSNP